MVAQKEQGLRLAQVGLADSLAVEELRGRPLQRNLAGLQDVRSIRQFERSPHVLLHCEAEDGAKLLAARSA